MDHNYQELSVTVSDKRKPHSVSLCELDITAEDEIKVTHCRYRRNTLEIS